MLDKKMQKVGKPTADEPPLVTVPQGAKLAHTSATSVYRWLDRGLIPDAIVVQLGRVYLRRAAWLAWLERAELPAGAVA